MKAATEYLIAAALVILLGLLANPWMVWMPTPALMAAVLFVAILAVIYAGFVYQERPADEREALHRALAGRAAFLTALGVLTFALIYQGSITHAIDPFIPATLALTILAKLISRAWAGRNQ